MRALLFLRKREVFSDPCNPMGKPTPTIVSKRQAYGGEMTNA
jgi:hypothetical protein